MAGERRLPVHHERSLRCRARRATRGQGTRSRAQKPGTFSGSAQERQRQRPDSVPLMSPDAQVWFCPWQQKHAYPSWEDCEAADHRNRPSDSLRASERVLLCQDIVTGWTEGALLKDQFGNGYGRGPGCRQTIGGQPPTSEPRARDAWNGPECTPCLYVRKADCGQMPDARGPRSQIELPPRMTWRSPPRALSSAG